MSEMEDLKRRIEKYEELTDGFLKEQQKTILVLNNIENSIAQIMVYVKGDPSAGILGIVAANNRFRADFMNDYVKDQNLNDEKLKNIVGRLEWSEGRVKVLEEIDKKSGNRMGFIVGGALVIGGFISWLVNLLYDII